MTETTLRGSIVAITGAGSGLGEATARAFAAEGSRVILIDRNSAAIDRLRDELGIDGGHIAITCDVRDNEQIRAAVRAVISRYERIDVLVNSAAIDHTWWIEQLTVEQWDQVLEINLRGPFLMAKAVWPHMKAQGHGHIFNIASTSSLRAASGAAAYTASKFGLLGLSRVMNLEGRADGIRVTAVIPGGMRTHFFDRFEAQGIPKPDNAVLQDPSNVARAMVFAAHMPPGSDLQELVITSPHETGWP